MLPELLYVRRQERRIGLTLYGYVQPGAVNNLHGGRRNGKLSALIENRLKIVTRFHQHAFSLLGKVGYFRRL